MRKRTPRGIPARVQALLVGGPLLGQVQADVDQGVVVAADVGEVDADLAVVDLAQAAAPLALDADRSSALLGEGRWVEDEDAVGTAQLLTHLPGQLREPGVVVPGRLADKLLQRLAFLVVEVGDGFDVLVFEVGNQARDIRMGMLPLFAPLEPFDEGVQEAFQSRPHAAEDAGIDFSVGQQLVAAGSKAAFHR